jgi:hypothetical protein
MSDDAVIPADDAFLGTWVLDPAQSRYQFGQPPKSGSYKISARGNRYHTDIQWTDQTDRAFEASYDAVPDGVEHPYENPAVADAVSMTRINAYTLDSASVKDGQRIAYARRVLSEDGQIMTITQSGVNTQGDSYVNLAVYVKQP